MGEIDAMNLPETCPFCDAGVALDCNMRPQRSDVSVVYECRTAIVDAHDIHRWQSDRCENAQKARAVDRVRELAARVAELEARCKRLEEAGDAVMDAAYNAQGWDGTRLGNALEAWVAAKEAKP